MPRAVYKVAANSLAAHFLSKLDRNGPVPAHRPALGPCWVWTDYCKENGYGQFYVNRLPVYAHRFSYALVHGPIPDELWVLHHCDNRPCCRPDHLYLGTTEDNTRDAIERGRLIRTRCRRGHSFADVGFRTWETPATASRPARMKRECLACILARGPRKPSHQCAGTTDPKGDSHPGERCLRPIPIDRGFCYSHATQEPPLAVLAPADRADAPPLPVDLSAPAPAERSPR